MTVFRYIDGGPPAGEPDMSSSIWRRYSEFELLRNYFVANFPAVSKWMENVYNITVYMYLSYRCERSFKWKSLIKRCPVKKKNIQSILLFSLLVVKECVPYLGKCYRGDLRGVGGG